MISVSTYVLKTSYVLSNASWEAPTQNRITPNEQMIHLQFIHLVKSVSDRSPQGFWGSGENGYLFSGSWGALVIIFRDLGSKFIVLWI